MQRIHHWKTISAFLHPWLELWSFNLQHAAGPHRNIVLYSRKTYILVLLEANRPICGRDTAKNNFGIFMSLMLTFGLSTFKMRRGDSGTNEEYFGLYQMHIGPFWQSCHQKKNNFGFILSFQDQKCSGVTEGLLRNILVFTRNKFDHL